MNNSRVLPLNDTTGTLTHTVLIGGSETPESFEFVSIVTCKEINRIPAAYITLNDGSSSEEDFEISNSDKLLPGKEIEIQAGYDGKNKTIFKGIIVKHSVRIKENKGSILSIVCKDKSVKLTIGRKSAYYEDMKDSDVIEKIIGTYGISKSVESTKLKHKELVQFYATDWDFILSRAEMNGQIVISNDNEIKTITPKTASPKVTLTYGSTLNEFEAEIDARYQFKSVKGYSWDSKKQELLEKEGAKPSANNAGNLSEDTLADVIGLSDFELRHSGQVIDQELLAWADSQRIKSSFAKVVGRAKIEGFTDVQPGDTIEVKGVGDRFNGKMFVSGVKQELIEGTWYTQLQLGISPNWFYQENEIVERPASGLLPGISGLQIGVVTKLEGDPDGEDRIQVVLPIVDGTAKGIWARLSSLDAGKERGFVFRPEINDEVIVGFINDDPRDAVVLGMLHSQKYPAPEAPTDDNHTKGLVTRSKMRVWFDDDKKIMTLDTPGGNKIEISEDAKSITLEDQNSNKIVMNDSGIEINSPKDIKITATGNIEIKASGDLKAEGTNVSLKASAELKADGQAGTKINSSAITEIKGSLVQIN